MTKRGNVFADIGLPMPDMLKAISDSNLTEQERLEWGKRFLRIWRKLDEEEARKVSEVIARQKATRKVNTEAAPK
jgi:hypothetical protein